MNLEIGFICEFAVLRELCDHTQSLWLWLRALQSQGDDSYSADITNILTAELALVMSCLVLSSHSRYSFFSLFTSQTKVCYHLIATTIYCVRVIIIIIIYVSVVESCFVVVVFFDV